MDSFLKLALNTDRYQKKPLTGDGGLRSHTRIHWNQESGILVHSMEKQQQELFLLRQQELESISIRVPQLKFTLKNSPYIFLEDLGNTSLEKLVLKKSPLVLSYYQQAVDQILNLQENAQDFSWRAYHFDLFLKEMMWTKKYLIDELLNLKFKDTVLNNFLKEWEEICKVLVSFPHLPAHRDYHSRNLMIKDQKIYMIDFQDAGLFPRFYDLVSLLYDPYAALSDMQRESIREYFLSQNSHFKQNTDEWEITVVQRFFKACGNFAYFSVLNNKDTHLKYIPPSIECIELMLSKIKKYPYFLDMICQLKQEVCSPCL